MRNRNAIKSELDFVNGATSLPKEQTKGRKRTYRAISVSLTESHISALDSAIQNAAINGSMGITRSDVVKAAIDYLSELDDTRRRQRICKSKS